MRSIDDLKELVKNKKILYIATKNSNYIRISQEVELIRKESAQCTIITSDKKKYIERILEVFWKLLFISGKQYDIVFVGFMAQMIIPVFSWKFKKCKVVTDFFISIYDTLVFDRKKFKESCAVSYILKWIDTLTIKKSDYIISDTKAHALYFCEEFNANEKNIFVYYLKADTSIYHPMNIKRKKRLEDKFVVVYFGSILPVQGVEVVMEAIRLLQNEKGIHFIMIGPMGNRIKKVESDIVTYINWVEQDILAKYIAIADLCLGGHFSKTVNKANRTIPGKVYIYQAMDKEIVLGASDANKELFSEKDKNLYWVELGNAEALAKLILDIKHKKLN